MKNSAKVLGAVLGIVTLAQVGVAVAACAGPKHPTFSSCPSGGAGPSSGQATRQGSQVKVDLINGTSATASLFTSGGAAIPTSTCPRPVDTATGLGNLSANAIRSCASVGQIQIVVSGP